MIVLLVVLALAVLLLVVLARYPWARDYARQVPQQALRLIRRPAPSEKVTVVQDGESFEADFAPRAPLPPPAGARASRLPAISQRTLMLVGLALVLVLGIVLFPRSFFVPRDQFAVIVAPFASPAGQVDEAGRAAARELVAELQRQGLAASAVSDAPASVADAETKMRQSGADAMLYGTLADGGTLDQPSLMPMLVYVPSGMYAPNAWGGYSGRFAMPHAYSLSAAPINGKVTLPPLLRALGAYGAGQYDSAYADLGTLLNDYPELAQPLPRAVRGNILWATGNMAAAADEYRRTGVLDMAPGQPSEMALLANNLGAILQDGRAADAEQAFAQAEALLGPQDLAELRRNRAIAMLSQQRYADAAAELERVPLASMPVETEQSLIDAYLGAKRLDDAERTLQDADLKVRAEAQATTDQYHDLLSQRLRAGLAAQRARLTLSRSVGSNDQLLWELLTGQALSRSEVDGPHQQIADTIDQLADLARRWQGLAVSADVSGHVYQSQVANQQARLADAARFEQRKLLAALDLELDRERNGGEKAMDGLASFFSGQRATTTKIEREMGELFQQAPQDAEAGVLLGFSQLAAGKRDLARQTFEQVNGFAASRPEPVFGLAQAALDTDRQQAKAYLGEAISRDPLFYPAHSQLALLAEQDGDWQTAIAQRRWLAEQRGSTQDTLALAATLQRSGAGGYADAEQVLLPLANQNSLDALKQLSDLYIAAGNLSAAQSALERASTIAPNDAMVAYQLGLVCKQQGQSDLARQQFEHAVALDGSLPQARVELGQIYATNGDFDRAAKQYDVALRSGTHDAAALQEIGRVLLIAGEDTRAMDAYRKAAELSPSDPGPRQGMARVYLAQGDAKAAAREAERAAALPGGSTAPTFALLGDISLALGDPKGATEHFTQAQQAAPGTSEPLLGLGRAAAAGGSWDVAQGYFTQVMALDPQSAEAHFWDGEARLQARDIQAAKAAYEQALALRANYPEAYYGLAKTQAAGAGTLAESHASVAKAVALRRSYPEAYVLDGLVYEQEGDRDAARESYTKAIDFDRTSAEAYYRRALLLIGDGSLSQARGDLESAVRYRSNFAEAHYWLGRSYLADGQASRASQQLDLALAQAPAGSYPEAQYYQGVAREQQGDRANAYLAYKSALEQAAGSPWAAEAQAALDRLGQ